MNILAVFENFEIRFVEHPEEKYGFGIVADDLATILDHSNSRSMSDSVDSDWKGVSNVYTLGGTQSATVIWEPGIYQLLSKSRKPKAKLFQKWLFEEVIPSIRKTGKYEIEQKPKTALELAKEQVKLLEQIELQQQIIDNQEKDLLRQSEVIDELFDYSSIIRIAKFNNVPESIFKWQTLKAASQKMNLEIKKVPCPRFGEKNLYSHDTWRFCYPSIKLPETTTLTISRDRI